MTADDALKTFLLIAWVVVLIFMALGVKAAIQNDDDWH